MWNPKPIRYKSPEYLGFIKLLPCEIDNEECMGQSIPHHVEPGGVGTKCDDTFTVSLCVGHHDEVHTQGVKTFTKKYNLDFWRIIARNMTKYLREVIDG